MTIHARSSLLLFAGFVAGVAASGVVAVYAGVVRTKPPAAAGHYTVSMDEVSQNLVFGDGFNDHYTRTITLSDGSVHQVTLTAISKNGQPMLELADASGGRVVRSAVGPFGTTTIGKLQVSVKDADVLHAEMHQVAGR